MSEPEQPRTAPDDWSDYYRKVAGREVRPLFATGLAAVAAAGVEPGVAVEIGYGDGTESVALLRAGWHVTAIDPAPPAAALLLEKVPPDIRPRLEIVTAGAESAELPDFDLLYAGYSLPFVEPAQFPAVWSRIREHIKPGGFVVANVFGVRDTWAGDQAMTFLDREAAEALLDGLEVISFREEDADGPSAAGPKHWHLFDLIARQPGATAE